MFSLKIKLVRFAHNLSRASLREPQGLTTKSWDWNDGTMEYWNIGSLLHQVRIIQKSNEKRDSFTVS